MNIMLKTQPVTLSNSAIIKEHGPLISDRIKWHSMKIKQHFMEKNIESVMLLQENTSCGHIAIIMTSTLCLYKDFNIKIFHS